MAEFVDERRCHELVAAVRAGDRQAETSLVEIFGRAVALLLDRHTSGRPEAEDLYQDTFRLALGKIRTGELRESAKLPAFLARLARNLAIGHYRQGARRKTETAGDDLPDLPSDGGTQLDLLVDRENVALVRRVFAELRNDRDREILSRFYLAEEDKQRIAEDLGLTSLQFNRVLHRARERFRELYLEHGGALPERVATIAGLVALLLLREGFRGPS